MTLDSLNISTRTGLCLGMLLALCGCNAPESTNSTVGDRDATTGDAADTTPSAAAPGDTGSEASSSAKDADSVTMMTCQGEEKTLTMKTLPDSRDYLYCELVFDYGDKGYDLYSTSHLGEASLDWWEKLDVKAVAEQYGAVAVMKNGPQRWSMDEVGLMMSEPVPVGESQMVFGGHLPPGTLESPRYTVFYPKKTQNLTWKAGSPTYQLVDPDGHVYLIQGYKVPKDDLATLSAKFEQLPDGWEYRVKVLEDDLEMKLSPDAPIPSVQDEFNQIYIRLPEGD